MLLGLLFLGSSKYGDYITYECPQVEYTCPELCDVDHKHLPIKECKDAKRKRNVWETGRKASKEKEVRKENDS